MTEGEFYDRVVPGSAEPLAAFLRLLQSERIPHCLIGGLAVNAYAEPVVSLDFDIVVVADRLEALAAKAAGTFTIERFANSVNLSAGGSAVRIQLQTDPRYQPFIGRATTRRVLGFELPVAAVEDVLQGKIWAAGDEGRRPSKRQKDLADIMRLVEAWPDLGRRLPDDLRERLYPDRSGA